MPTKGRTNFNTMSNLCIISEASASPSELLKRLISLLREGDYSLVVCSTDGEQSVHNQAGVRDLIRLLDYDADRLRGAVVADKVIGRAAASLMVIGGVSEAYGEVMSRAALPFLHDAGIRCSWGTLVDAIADPDDGRCRLEQIVLSADTPRAAERLLREHFDEVRRQQQD